jgi:uncharacterized membrane protein (UPF0127 family)
VSSQSEQSANNDSDDLRVRVAGNETWLAEDLRYAKSHWARFRGLMLSSSLPRGGGLVIPGCRSIHMLFMRFPIDAVFFDRSARVTRVCRHVRPWIGLGWGGRHATGVIELPRGAASDVQPGQQLEFLP